MNNDQLFRGFLAALRMQGQLFIDTRDDVHQEKFARVVERLEGEDATRADKAGLPRSFTSSLFTGRFLEYNNSLIDFHRGGLLSLNSMYNNCINIEIDEDYAQMILGKYSEDQKNLFTDLAKTYLSSEVII